MPAGDDLCPSCGNDRPGAVAGSYAPGDTCPSCGHVEPSEDEDAWKSTDWWLVCFDETSDWNIPDEDKQYISKIFAIYVFDRSHKAQYATSMAQYALHFVNYNFEFSDKVYESPDEDELRERLFDEYGNQYPDDLVSYYSQSYIESYIKKNPHMVDHYGPAEDDEAREHYQGNCFYPRPHPIDVLKTRALGRYSKDRPPTRKRRLIEID